MSRVITIGREFGSGGREVGKRLAELLQIPYYDNEIVTQLAERTQLCVHYVKQFSEKGLRPVEYFPITIGRTFTRQTLPTTMNPLHTQNTKLHGEQTKLLKELAEKSDCVIVGRAACEVLVSHRPLKIFIYADMDSKMERCRLHSTERERMSDVKLKQHILNVDKARALYYKNVTGKVWDDKLNFDFMFNTSQITPKAVAQTLFNYLQD